MLEPLIPMGGRGAPQVGPDGTFVLESLSPGRYRVNVTIPQQTAYVESVLLGNQEVLGQEIDLGSGAGPLRVTLNTNGASVAGTVMQGEQPASGASVYLVPADKARRSLTQSATADQNGAFSVKNLAPGSYLAFAMTEPDPSFWEDESEFLSYERKGAKVTVSAGGSETVSLKVID